MHAEWVIKIMKFLQLLALKQEVWRALHLERVRLCVSSVLSRISYKLCLKWQVSRVSYSSFIVHFSYAVLKSHVGEDAFVCRGGTTLYQRSQKAVHVDVFLHSFKNAVFVSCLVLSWVKGFQTPNTDRFTLVYMCYDPSVGHARLTQTEGRLKGERFSPCSVLCLCFVM